MPDDYDPDLPTPNEPALDDPYPERAVCGYPVDRTDDDWPG